MLQGFSDTTTLLRSGASQQSRDVPMVQFKRDSVSFFSLGLLIQRLGKEQAGVLGNRLHCGSIGGAGELAAQGVCFELVKDARTPPVTQFKFHDRHPLSPFMLLP